MYYIKMDWVSESEAVKKLKEIWGRIYQWLLITNKLEWSNIIQLDEQNDIYYTLISETSLKQDWYTEIKLNEIQRWTPVWVDNYSQETAYVCFKDTKWYYYTKLDNWKFICYNDKNNFSVFNYISNWIKEKKPKFKVWDKVCIDEEYYWLVEWYNIESNQYYITKRQYDNEDDIRLATQEEINLYFN